MQSSLPLNADDKNARPFVVSLDWLSVSCHTTDMFMEVVDQPTGYKVVRMEHGSTIFEKLADVYDPDGVHIGELSWKPYSSALDERLAIMKADNALLYSQGGFEQFWAAVGLLQLRYIGIHRVDLACDQNEFYGGLLPSSLIGHYFKAEWLKLGSNEGFSHFDMRYHGCRSGDGLRAWSKIPLSSEKARAERLSALQERNKELRELGLPLLDESEAHVIDMISPEPHNSVTWGTRNSDVQVQIYNKTKELCEKKMKRWIVDAWKEGGLDVSRDIYRVEIRIHGRGKGLTNPETGELFNLNLVDLVLQEQIEELFFAFAEKYFAFFRDEGKVKKRQNSRVKLWNRRPPVLKPKLTPKKKNPSRFTLQLLNAVERERVSIMNDPSMETTQRALAKVSDYFQTAYDLKKWLEDRELSDKLQRGEFLGPKDVDKRMNQSWLYGDVAQRVMAKVRAWNERARKTAVFWDNLLDNRRTYGNYMRALEHNVEHLTFTEAVPGVINDIPDNNPNYIDWDNIQNT